jgi:4-amino-4-deoxy-L-arabinose transferase-like glycosyltransferase
MHTLAAPPAIADSAVPVVPGWFDRVMAIVLSILLGFSIVALPLALLGLYSVGTVLPLGAVAAYTIHLFWFLESPAPVRTAGNRPAVAVLIVVVASTVFSTLNAGEHVIADSEPGVTINAARQLSVSGDLIIDAGVGPFADAAVGFASEGFEGEGAGGELSSPVPHLFAALGGIAGWTGVNGILVLAPLLGGVLLLAFYWLAARMVKAWTAATLTLILALSLPFALIARDAYPELLAGIFVLAGLALHWDYERRLDVNRAAIAGLLLGCAALARPEWALLAIPIAVVATLDWLEASEKDFVLRRRHRRWLGVFIVAYAIPVLGAWADAAVNDAPFLESFNSRWTVGAVVTVAVVYGMARLSRVSLGAPRFAWIDLRGAAAAAIAALIVVGGLAGLYLRPETRQVEVSTEIELIQLQEGAEIDGARTYGEDSFVWVGWYYGAAAPVLGLFGFAGMVYTAITSRDRRPYLFLFSAVVVSVAFLADPGSSPIQLDVMRRYLPLTIPAVLIGIGWLADRVMEVEWRFTEVSQTAVILVLAGAVAFAAFQLAPLAQAVPYDGSVAGIESICASIGDDAAVLVLAGESSVMGDRITQTVRGFCRMPTARGADLTPAETSALDDAWQAVGRRLVLVAPTEASLIAAGGDPTAVTAIAFDFRVPEQRVEGVPDDEVVRKGAATVAPVDE